LKIPANSTFPKTPLLPASWEANKTNDSIFKSNKTTGHNQKLLLPQAERAEIFKPFPGNSSLIKIIFSN